MSFGEKAPGDAVATLLAEQALDTLDRKFCHIVDTVKLVLDVPAAVVALADGGDERMALPQPEAPALLAPILAAAVEADGPLVVPDLAADRRFAAAEGAMRACLAVPFSRAGGPGGVLVAFDARPRVFTAHEVSVLSQLARCVVSELELYERATRDDLTLLMRRQPFMRALGEIVARFRRTGTPAALSIVDLDHFKRVNDEHGHLMGDRVLRVVADSAREVLGREPLLARLGGEEFAIAFPATHLCDALRSLVRLQTTIARLRFPERPTLKVTASFGVTALTPALPNVSAWCRMADAALYGAKQAGRNQVRVAFAADGDASDARLAQLAAFGGPGETTRFALAG